MRLSRSIRSVFLRCTQRPGSGSAPRARARPGFTLIELLLALSILGILAGIAATPLHAAIDRARLSRAISEISMLQREIAMYEVGKNVLPATLGDIGRTNMLDPWGNPYVYFVFPAPGGTKGGGGGGTQPRKDRFLHPINSTYDLYSMGADGKSNTPLTASMSQDDVIRANDGAYIGLASGY